jgi:hypothetical protein
LGPVEEERCEPAAADGIDGDLSPGRCQHVEGVPEAFPQGGSSRMKAAV